MTTLNLGKFTLEDDQQNSRLKIIANDTNNEFYLHEDGTIEGAELNVTDADIGKLISALDVNGQDLTGLGSVSTDKINTADASAASQGEALLKDSSGTDLKFGSAGLSDGDDFDGQGTSEFTNLKSVDTDQLTNETGLSESRTPLSYQTGVVDDWSRGGLSYWSGDTGNHSVASNTVLQGANSLETTTNFPGWLYNNFRMYRGWELLAPVYFSSTNKDNAIYLGIGQSNSTAVGSDDGYTVLLDNGNDLRIRRLDGGTRTSLDSANLPSFSGSWKILRFRYGYSEIQAEVLNRDGTNFAGPISTTDTTYAEGYVHHRLSSDGTNTVYGNEIIRRVAP